MATTKMTITGKFETYDSNTFTIQLCMNDITDLDIFFRHQLDLDDLIIEPRPAAKKFIDMIHEAAVGTSFGFDKFFIDKN